MADSPAVDSHQRIELQLGLAEEAWGELPAVEAEIDRWSSTRRTTFLEEWLLQEDLLVRLGRRATAGEMTADQLARWRGVQRLVQEQRPIAERLLSRRRGLAGAHAPAAGEVATG